MDSTLASLQALGRDLKNSLDVSSSTEIDRQLKELIHAVEIVRETLERAKKSQEVKLTSHSSYIDTNNFFLGKRIPS